MIKGKKVDICDSCGWRKEIIYVDKFGKGFCRECINETQESDKK